MVRTGFFSLRKFWTPRSLRALVRDGSLNFLLNFHPIFKHFLFSAISHSITPKTMFSYKSVGRGEAVGSEIFLFGKIVSPLEIHCKLNAEICLILSTSMFIGIPGVSLRSAFQRVTALSVGEITFPQKQ